MTNSVPQPKSRVKLVMPDKPLVTEIKIQTADIGGSPIQYLPDPTIARTVQPQQLTDANVLCSVLTEVLRTCDALCREVIIAREREDLRTEEIKSNRAGMAKLAAALENLNTGDA